MSIGQAYKNVLTRREHKALEVGCDLLIDMVFDDLATILYEGQERVAHTALAVHLPSRFLSKYSPLFCKRFAVCILTVAWKLAQPKHHPLSSVAEELAAWAIVNQARAVIEMERGTEAAEQAFGDFINAYFEDTDFLVLFEESLDGLDESPADQNVGMTSLAFANWFRPLSMDPSRTAHPYILQR